MSTLSRVLYMSIPLTSENKAILVWLWFCLGLLPSCLQTLDGSTIVVVQHETEQKKPGSIIVGYNCIVFIEHRITVGRKKHLSEAIRRPLSTGANGTETVVASIFRRGGYIDTLSGNLDIQSGCLYATAKYTSSNLHKVRYVVKSP